MRGADREKWVYSEKGRRERYKDREIIETERETETRIHIE